MNTYFRFVSIFFLLFTSFLLAQNSKDSILVYTYAEKNSISLKWLITSKDLYVQAKKSGFEVTRFSLKYVDNKPQLTNPVKITPVPIKPMPFDRIKANAEVYPDLKKALFFEASEQLMDKKFETYEESYTAQDYSSLYLGFGIFSVASYNIVAKVTGMYYEDKGVNTALEYVYKVNIAGSPNMLGVAYHKKSEANKQYKVEDLKANMYKSQVKLTWYHNIYSNIVYYNIYRSLNKDDGYVKLNNLPFVGNLTPDANIKNNSKEFLDSVELGKTYYYKVVGVNMFEKQGIPSEFVKVEAFKQLEFSPEFKSVMASQKNTIEVEWETEAIDLPWIKQFDIYHSNKPESDFRKLNSKPLTASTFSFTHQNVKYSSNYYLICVKGKGGDSVFSNTKMLLLEDNTPPVKPIFVLGTCDTNNVVTLKWKQNKEMDLLGYRLFRTFDDKSEQIRVTDGHVIDTVFVDSLPKNRIDRKVFYVLYALDNHVNPSEPTAMFAVKIPDRRKPDSPQLQGFKVTKQGVELNVVRSYSEDLLEQRLLRKSEYDFDWQPIMVFKGDSLNLSSIVDTSTRSRVWYQYALQAIDSSGFKSDLSTVYRVFQEDKNALPKVTNLQAFVSRPNKKVKLTWDFNVLAGSFTIYRGAKDKPMIEYTTVNGDKREFYDDFLTPNTKYTYKIAANLPNFKPSLHSDDIVVKY